MTPTSVVPGVEQQLAPAPPPGMRVVGYVRIDGVLHPQYGPAYEQAAPAPAPAGFDPQAQRTAARGVLAAGVGIGAYFGMQALQILVDSLVRLLAVLAVAGAAWALQGGRRAGRDAPTYVTNNRGFLAGWRSQNGPRR
ncbi:hypothetical protein [Streptomyces seoulensis]|uniref:hypothetical protein n=1 Tax=Streptomyces seoulensis TaxID=73044 RepID=UPI001FCAC77A|nr:hypothetical protein [Streptomyces seoulensis]